jgi:hypothetical protein
MPGRVTSTGVAPDERALPWLPPFDVPRHVLPAEATSARRRGAIRAISMRAREDSRDRPSD